MDSSIILIAIAIMTVLVLLIFAFAGPNPEKVVRKRLTAIHDRLMPSNEAVLAAQMRKTIAARLPSQEFGITKLLPNPEKLTLRLRQTGKKWTLSNYLMANIGIAVVVAALGLIQGAPVMLAVLAGLGLGFGIPHMVVGSMIGKRVAKFNARFPDAIDLLVRGLRSGLPIAETLQAVSTEVPGPVGIEFKQVIERVRIGKTMEAALQETADTLNTPEFQFFCITIAIQRETGGNLAETLANLSDVLRKRAQMKLKIKAMSSEATASAYIIGSLPFLVFALIWFMNPEYVTGFFTDESLIIAGLGGLGWMSIGVFIMSQMISFEI
jgi:tight adherence protein B